jgi:peroxiredoxin
LAEYRECYPELIAAGVSMAAISVDAPARADAMKADLKLPFPILCDSQRELIIRWGLLNEKEMGGIAFPAAFAIDREMRVRFRSLDKTARRAGPAEVAAVVRAVAAGASSGAELQLRRVRPGALFFRSVMNSLRRGVRTPWSRESGKGA